MGKGLFSSAQQAFARIIEVLDELREKCPWDRKQTNESLRPNTLEEVYELSEALINNDTPDICKELGDVALHVAFYAKIASEKGQFDMKDVCDRLCDKLIYRHPHVFPKVESEKMTDENATNSQPSTLNSQPINATQVSENWEQLKLREKGGNKRVLSGVPAGLPSIVKAYRIQEKARNVGFEWDDASGAWDKLLEEINFDEYDLLVLPGGVRGTNNLNACEELKKNLVKFNDQGKGIAAICAAPTVFANLGLLKGKTSTCNPGFWEELRANGADVIEDSKVVVNDNIITSQAMGTSVDFGLELVGYLCGEEEKESLRKNIRFGAI